MLFLKTTVLIFLSSVPLYHVVRGVSLQTADYTSRRKVRNEKPFMLSALEMLDRA